MYYNSGSIYVEIVTTLEFPKKNYYSSRRYCGRVPTQFSSPRSFPCKVYCRPSTGTEMRGREVHSLFVIVSRGSLPSSRSPRPLFRLFVGIFSLEGSHPRPRSEEGQGRDWSFNLNPFVFHGMPRQGYRRNAKGVAKACAPHHDRYYYCGNCVTTGGQSRVSRGLDSTVW